MDDEAPAELTSSPDGDRHLMPQMLITHFHYTIDGLLIVIDLNGNDLRTIS